MKGFFNKKRKNTQVISNTNQVNAVSSHSNIDIIGDKVIVNERGNRDYIQGDGISKTITLEVQDFHSLDVSSVIDVDFTVDETSSIQITADSNLIDVLCLDYFGGTLYIDTKDNVSFSSKTPMKITIAHPHLKAVSLSGTANLCVRGLDQDNVDVDVSGTGDVDISGKATSASFNVSGQGDINAIGLVSENLKAVVSGMGDVQATATHSVTASVSGMGDITIHGNPTQKHSKTSGMGDINFV